MAMDSWAVLADIHGNRWALEAVLRDVERRGIRSLVNLGDVLTGPLDPVGTADLLLRSPMPTVGGNDDRALFAPPERLAASARFARERLRSSDLEWLHSLPATLVIDGDLFLCHGDRFDSTYLLEEVGPGGVSLRSTDDIQASVGGIAQAIILSGHSHLPRTVSLPDGRLLVNPGSVGLPAYDMDTPVPHRMESGSPHARYAIISRAAPAWQVEHVQLAYEWDLAAAAAAAGGRPDWADWLRSGRVAPA